MMVLCILLAMLSLFLSLKLIYQRKLVQKVKKQIDFLIDRDTQTEIMVEKTDGTIQDYLTTCEPRWRQQTAIFSSYRNRI